MHKEKIKYYDSKKKEWLECEADTFDTVVHMNKGVKHALKDIERLLKEEEAQDIQGILDDCVCECKRCGYQWIPRSLNRPARCPKCQSRNWNKPKKEG